MCIWHRSLLILSSQYRKAARRSFFSRHRNIGAWVIGVTGLTCLILVFFFLHPAQKKFPHKVLMVYSNALLRKMCLLFWDIVCFKQLGVCCSILWYPFMWIQLSVLINSRRQVLVRLVFGSCFILLINELLFGFLIETKQSLPQMFISLPLCKPLAGANQNIRILCFSYIWTCCNFTRLKNLIICTCKLSHFT
jgi:hypothetical protein